MSFLEMLPSGLKKLTGRLNDIAEWARAAGKGIERWLRRFLGISCKEEERVMATSWQQLPNWREKFLAIAQVVVRVPIILVLLAVSLGACSILVGLTWKSTRWFWEHVILKTW